MKIFKKHKRFVVFFVVVLVIYIAFLVNFMIITVSGESMLPTLSDGQLLMSHKTFKTLERFDIVILLDDNKSPLIKRIIGLPDDVIEYKDNQLYINGEISYEDIYSIGETEDFKVKISPNSYFCMGDNREYSRDSRVFGEVSKKDIIAEIF